MAVKTSAAYAVIHRVEWQSSIVENVWITLKPTNDSKNINIACYYVPGDIEAKYLELITNEISDVLSHHPDDDFLIVGDFNVPSFSSANSPSAKARQLKQLLLTTGLEQFNNIRSKEAGSNLLDLVLANNIVDIEPSDDPLVPVDGYHPPFEVSFAFNKHVKNPVFSS